MAKLAGSAATSISSKFPTKYQFSRPSLWSKTGVKRPTSSSASTDSSNEIREQNKCHMCMQAAFGVDSDMLLFLLIAEVKLIAKAAVLLDDHLHGDDAPALVPTIRIPLGNPAA